jgi:hypothetical protein
MVVKLHPMRGLEQGLSRYSAGPSEEQRIEAVKAITLPS